MCKFQHVTFKNNGCLRNGSLWRDVKNSRNGDISK